MFLTINKGEVVYRLNLGRRLIRNESSENDQVYNDATYIDSTLTYVDSMVI